ncbi:hypothetical protein BV25DRAFT_1825356 [Artomyces pyxidatus]|uniref:Uncharacterized protein n=1 Tax=Artomyces pyxidatus TaxID=48021 RepID=A0ACB8T2R8_9AGAM|nr:hypothetical protein BV25DRAFT_1825356 [Artomyces pyxidatus]
MSSFLSNSKFLPSLKRQPAVRNRSADAKSPASRSKASKGRPHLPVLPELSEEEDVFSSSSTTSYFSPTQPASRSLDVSAGHSSSAVCTSNKRISRYGKSEFVDDTTFTAPRPAPRPPSAPTQSTRSRKSVRLSAFDIQFDFDISEYRDPNPTPTATQPPMSFASSTPPRHRSLSPTPSISSDFTSTSGSSTGGMPITPTSSDDEEWSPFLPSPKIAPKRVSIHPLVITKSVPAFQSPDASPVESFEFTVSSSSSACTPKDEQVDDVMWYYYEMGGMFTPPSPQPALVASRRDSLPLPSRGISPRGPRSRHSKPLPPVPESPVPSPLFDPTFPRRKFTIPPLPKRPPPPPPSHAPRRNSHALTINVPRPLPRMSLPADVTDILEDMDAWTMGGPSDEPLSPPRMPESPSSPGDAKMFGQFTPIDIEFSHSPIDIGITPDTPLAQMYDARAQEKYMPETGFEPMLRSRWSSSTLSTVAPSPLSASSRLKFHFGGMAKRAMTRRDSRQQAPLTRENVERGRQARMSIDSAESRSDSGDSSSSSGLRRKPIPVEIFMRQ